MFWAIFFGVIVGILLVALILFFVVKAKLQRVSKEMFGTEDFAEGYNAIANQVASTPKSVNSMTRIMEPQISRDFPEFSWNEFKHRAENMLLSALRAIEMENPDVLMDCDNEVRNQVVNRITDNQLASVIEHYDQTKIHQTEIANYRKANGTCVITIQSAIEYYYYKTAASAIGDEKILAGSRTRKKQTKYNMELLYIQDSSVTFTDNAVGTTCPNCGAVVTALGHKYCEFCGAGITPINIKVWSLHNFTEVDYNMS